MEQTLINKNHKWKLRFFTIWSGQIFSLFSSGIVQFAIIWWLTENTGSAITLSIATIISLLPESLLNPFIGALVDRWNRRIILIVSDLIIAICSVVLAILFIFNIIQIWHIYVGLFIRSIFTCFHNNSMISSTSLMVPEKQLIRIAGLNQTLQGMMMFVTPAIGAILLRLSTFEIIMLIDVAGALIAVLPLLFIKIPQPEKTKTMSGEKQIHRIFRDVADGFIYIKKWIGARGMLAISTTVNFVMQPVFMLLAIYVTKNLAGDEIKFGLIGSMIGIGFMAGGIILSIVKGFKRKMVTSIFGIIGAGISVLINGLLPSTTLTPIMVFFFTAGFMMPICMGPIQSLIQSSVSPGLQGRVFSIMSSISALSTPISLGIAGIIFDLYTPQLWYIYGGIVVIITGICGLLIKNIRNLSKAPKE